MNTSNSNDPKRRKCLVKNCYLGDVKAWTTAQCHRLLRPISSRVEILKKEHIRFVESQSPHAHVQSIAKPVVPSNAVSAYNEDEDASVDRDPDWCPRRKRLRRTYSGRRKTNHKHSNYDSVDPLETSQKSLLPGEISIPTPFLNRGKDLNDLEECIRPHLPTIVGDPKIDRQVQGAKYGVHFQLSEQMRQIKETDPSRYSLYDGIFNAVDSLLKATKPAPTEQSIPQSKSLLSLCLRAIPRYIKDEASWMSSEVKESGEYDNVETWDVSTKIYSFLEHLGTSTGWKHLRTVVRAHGIAVVSDAIAEGFISCRFASVLVMLCVHKSSYDEGESLLDTLLTSFDYPTPQSAQSKLCDDPAMLPVLILNSFVKQTGRLGYYHRKLATLFSAGSLPIAWLATKDFAFVWNSVFLSLSRNPPDHNASTFMSTILPVLYTAVGAQTIQADMLSVLDAIFTSVMITLSAMANLGWKIIHILRSVMIDCGIFSSTLGDKQSKIIATANLLVSLENFTIPTNDGEFFKELVHVLARNRCHDPTAADYADNIITTFICSVARCCGRGSPSSGFGHLKTMLGHLSSKDINSAEAKGIIPGVIVRTALAFAQEDPTQEHLGYAEKIKTTYLDLCASNDLSPSLSERFDFRWEEGISEWVSITPATLKRRRNISLSRSSDDEAPRMPSFKLQRPATSDHSAKELYYAYMICSQDVDPVRQTPHTDCKSSYGTPYARTLSNGQRKPNHKTPRAGGGVFWTKEEFKILDESDDELCSSGLGPLATRPALSEGSQYLNRRRQKQPKGTRPSGQSEDELCV